MMPQSHSCAKWSRGQAAVELAFSVPLLIVLLLVVVETGRICLVAIALSVRRGPECSMVRKT